MELGCSQTGSVWDGWGQEEPQGEQEVPVPFPLVWGALLHAPHTGATEGQPLPPGAVGPAGCNQGIASKKWTQSPRLSSLA